MSDLSFVVYFDAAHPEIAAVMAAGQLVDSRLVLDVVRQRLAQPDIKEHGFILDGFPRRGGGRNLADDDGCRRLQRAASGDDQ